MYDVCRQVHVVDGATHRRPSWPCPRFEPLAWYQQPASHWQPADFVQVASSQIYMYVRVRICMAASPQVSKAANPLCNPLESALQIYMYVRERICMQASFPFWRWAKPILGLHVETFLVLDFGLYM